MLRCHAGCREEIRLDNDAEALQVSETGEFVTMAVDLPNLLPEQALWPSVFNSDLIGALSRVVHLLIDRRPKDTWQSGALVHPMAPRTDSNPNIAWIEDALSGGLS